MTVEEWIRYQIEVEQDRFKRDGERELERFKKRAEEVNHLIDDIERCGVVECRFWRIAGLVSVDEEIYGIGRGDGLFGRGF